MKEKDILDPLWITKCESNGIDAEYCKYVLLDANKKYRKLLDQGNTDRFYEILFHSLNLNNLAIYGKIYDSKMNYIKDNPKLKEIREYLKNMYTLPNDMIEIFRNTNYVLVSLLIDYLDVMLDTLDDCKIYYINQHIHAQREIFIIRNNINNEYHDICKLRFDARYKFSHSLKYIERIELKDNTSNALEKAIKNTGNLELKNFNPVKNVVFVSHSREIEDHKELVNAVSNTIVFYRAFDKNHQLDPNILDELREVLLRDRVIPFALKSIV